MVFHKPLYVHADIQSNHFLRGHTPLAFQQISTSKIKIHNENTEICGVEKIPCKWQSLGNGRSTSPFANLVPNQKPYLRQFIHNLSHKYIYCNKYNLYIVNKYSISMEHKVVVLGDKGVGKTCLVLRFIEGFYTSKQQSTVGAFFLTKRVVLNDGTSFKMQLWDTAGQERFRAMAPVLTRNSLLQITASNCMSQMYYRNAAAAIVCFDITNNESFDKMKDWIDELTQNVSIPFFIIMFQYCW